MGSGITDCCVQHSLKIEKLSKLAQEPSIAIPKGLSREERRKFSKSQINKGE